MSLMFGAALINEWETNNQNLKMLNQAVRSYFVFAELHIQ